MNLKFAVPQVNWKFFVDFQQDIPFIVNFLPKTNRIFQGINLLQVKCSPTKPTRDFQSINSPTRISFFPRMEFRLVLFSICQVNYPSSFFSRYSASASPQIPSMLIFKATTSIYSGCSIRLSSPSKRLRTS